MTDELGIAVLELKTNLAPLEAGLDAAEAMVVRRVAQMQAIADSLHLDLNSFGAQAAELDAAAVRMESAATRGGGGGLINPSGGGGAPTPNGGGAVVWGSRGSEKVGSIQNPLVVAVESGKYTGLGTYGSDITQSSAGDGQRGQGAVADAADMSALRAQMAQMANAMSRVGAFDAHGPGVASGATQSGPTTVYNYSYRYDTASAASGRGDSGAGNARPLSDAEMARIAYTNGATSSSHAFPAGTTVNNVYDYNYGGTGGAAGGAGRGGSGGGPPVAYGGYGPGFGGGGGGNRRTDIYYHGGAGGGGSRTMYIPGFGLRNIPDKGSPFSFGNIFKGDEGRGGAFGLPGFGSLGSIGGLGLEHWLLTGLGLTASAGSAVGGAGLLASAGLTQAAVGGGADMLVNHTAMTNVKGVVQDYQALQVALVEYGKGSKEAVAAQNLLNYQVQQAGPDATKTAYSYVALKKRYDEMAKSAESESTVIFDQVLKLGSSYLPLVIQAAQKNLGLVNDGIKPLFSWLEGPEGKGIFDTLESKFSSDLPTSIHAIDMAIEDFLRLMAAASKYTGGLSKDLDNFFTDKNRESAAAYDAEVQKLVGDLHEWGGLLKVLAEDMGGLFRADQGTASSIVKLLTQMLDRLHKWEDSTTGEEDLRNIFEVHKQEIEQILDLLPELVKGYGSFYMDVAPAVVKAFTDILDVVNPLLTAIEKIPGGAEAIGSAIVLAKLGMLKSAVSGLAGMFGLLADKEAAAGGLAALGGGEVAAGGAAARAGVSGAEDVVEGGAAGLVSSRAGMLSTVAGKYLGGDAVAAGVTSGGEALAGATGIEALGAGGAALAPLIGTILPVVVAGIAAYGGYKILTDAFKGSQPTTTYKPEQLLQLLGQHGAAALHMPANPREAAASAPTKASAMTGALGMLANQQGAPGGLTIGQTADTEQMKAALQLYLNMTSSAGNLSKLDGSALDRMIRQGQQLRTVFQGNSGDVDALDKSLQSVKNTLMPLDNAMALIMQRFHQDANAGLKVLDGDFDSNTRLIATMIGLNTTQGRTEMADNVKGMVSDLTKGMSDGKISVTSGMAAIKHALSTGMSDGAMDWTNSTATMLGALQTLLSNGKITAGQFSTGVSGAITNGMAAVIIQVDKQIGAQKTALQAELKAGFLSPKTYGIQLAALNKSILGKQATASETFLSNLTTTLEASGRLGIATMKRIDAAQASLEPYTYTPASPGKLKGAPGHATGGMVNSPTYIAGEEGAAHPEFVIASNPAYRADNVQYWMQAGHALGIKGFAEGGVIGDLNSIAKMDTGTVGSRTDMQVIAAAIKLVNGLIGSGGQGGASGSLMNQLQFYTSMIGFTDPNYGQSAGSYVISTDPTTGLAITPYIDQSAVNTSMGEYKHELSGFINPAISDIGKAKPYVTALLPAITHAINYRRATLSSEVSARRQKIAAAQAQIKANLQQIANLQKQVTSYQNKITAEEGKKKPNYASIASWKKQIGALNGQISQLESQNKSLGGDQTSVGTGGQIGGWDKQINGLQSSYASQISSLQTDRSSNLSGLGASVFADNTGSSVLANDLVTKAGVTAYIAGLANPLLNDALMAAVNGSSGASATSTSTDASDVSAAQTLDADAEFIMNAQAPILAAVPPFGGSFATGGTVPGALGEPRMILAHGGEVVKTPQQAAAAHHVHVVVEDGAVDPSKIRVIARQEVESGTRRMAKKATRSRAGQRAGMLTLRP